MNDEFGRKEVAKAYLRYYPNISLEGLTKA
jgi:hypothetical protein